MYINGVGSYFRLATRFYYNCIISYEICVAVCVLRSYSSRMTANKTERMLLLHQLQILHLTKVTINHKSISVGWTCTTCLPLRHYQQSSQQLPLTIAISVYSASVRYPQPPRQIMHIIQK